MNEKKSKLAQKLILNALVTEEGDRVPYPFEIDEGKCKIYNECIDAALMLKSKGIADVEFTPFAENYVSHSIWLKFKGNETEIQYRDMNYLGCLFNKMDNFIFQSAEKDEIWQFTIRLYFEKGNE